MATKTYTVLHDDIDGNSGEDVETIQFGFLGKSYEIDLSESHRDEFTDAIRMYVDAGRPAGKSATVRSSRAATTTSSSSSSGSTDPNLAAQVRAWARENGVEVPARGRIPKTVLAEYAAATADA